MIHLWCAKHFKGFRGPQVPREAIAALNMTGNFFSVLVSKLSKIFLVVGLQGIEGLYAESGILLHASALSYRLYFNEEIMACSLSRQFTD